jgi:hypothetical protein
MIHFSKALADIGNALRKTRLSAELYQHDEMKNAVAQLYAHIILFFQRAVRWYNRSRIGRAVEAIINPVELEYEDSVRQIQACADTVNDIATLSSRVELRDVQTLLKLKLPQLEDGMRRIESMQQSLQATATTNLQVVSREYLALARDSLGLLSLTTFRDQFHFK